MRITYARMLNCLDLAAAAITKARELAHPEAWDSGKMFMIEEAVGVADNALATVEGLILRREYEIKYSRTGNMAEQDCERGPSST